MNHRSLLEAATEYLAELVGSSAESPTLVVPALSQKTCDQLATLAARTLPFTHPPQEPGQVWSVPPTTSQHIPVFVLVTEVASTVLGTMALSDRAWMATDEDVIVPGDQSPTGHALVVFPWRLVALAPAGLNRCIGAVGASALQVLIELANPVKKAHRRLVTTCRASDIHSSESTVDTLLQWSLPGVGAGSATFLTGPPLLGPFDPRAEVRQAWLERTAHLEALSFVPNTAIEPQPMAEPSFAEKVFERLWNGLTALVVCSDSSVGQNTQSNNPSPVTSGLPIASLTPGFAAVRGLTAQQETKTAAPKVVVARLGCVELEIEGYVQADGIVLSASAFFADTDAAVSGVVLQVVVLNEKEPKQILWQAERTTDEHGVIHGLTIPLFGDAVYEGTLRYEGVEQRWSW